MNVSLVSYSQPTGKFKDMGVEDAQELIKAKISYQMLLE